MSRRPAGTLLLSILCAAVAATVAWPAGAAAQEAPRTILVRGERLAEAKRRLAAGDRDLQPALGALVSRARAALAAPMLSVTQKQITPPSGDMHDYMSLAPYWWPNPATRDGLPYVRRDGEFNPQSRTDHDGLRLQRTIMLSKTLAYAWYFSGDPAFAEGAARRLRVFFIDPATRMHPNLTYGQAVLGVTEGRGAGMIDTRVLPDLVDTLRVLEDTPAWTAADREAMEAWCRSFLAWMFDSPQGRDEGAATNNHGVFYDAQVAALALYVGDTARARAALDSRARARIADQIRRDGSQPLELERTRPLHYSVFTLDAFTMLAEMARHVNVDLWHAESTTGASIAGALRFVAPYVASPGTFPRKDVTPFNPDVSLLPLRRAVAAIPDDTFIRALAALPTASREGDLSVFEFVLPAVR